MKIFDELVKVEGILRVLVQNLINDIVLQFDSYTCTMLNSLIPDPYIILLALEGGGFSFPH